MQIDNNDIALLQDEIGREGRVEEGIRMRDRFIEIVRAEITVRVRRTARCMVTVLLVYRCTGATGGICRSVCGTWLMSALRTLPA